MRAWLRASRLCAAGAAAAFGVGRSAAAEEPELEGDPDELLLESWAHCAARKHHDRGDGVKLTGWLPEDGQPSRHTWRRRAAWISLDCGDDSFFVSKNRRVVGVADGVGGWETAGVDSSALSNELMRLSKALSEAHPDEVDPALILVSAWQAVRDRGVAGGTTAVYVSITSDNNTDAADGKATGVLRVANLGDSGVAVVRQGGVVWRATELQHRFGAPYQLTVLPEGNDGADVIQDSPEKAWIGQVPVREGDVVITASDGYFDNTGNKLTGGFGDLVLNSTGEYGGAGPWHRYKRRVFARMMARDVAKLMVMDTARRSTDKDFMSPFAQTMLELGIATTEDEAKGGKPDDITVVLSRVIRRRDWKEAIGMGGGETGGWRGVGCTLHHMENQVNLGSSSFRAE